MKQAEVKALVILLSIGIVIALVQVIVYWGTNVKLVLFFAISTLLLIACLIYTFKQKVKSQGKKRGKLLI